MFTLCLERDEPRRCTGGKALHRALLGYRTMLPLFQEGERMDCLMKRVLVGKLLMEFRCTGIQNRGSFSDILSYPCCFSFFLRLAGLWQIIPINAPRYAHNHTLV